MTEHNDSDEPLGNGDSHWHFTRGIPVAFIVTMAFYVISQTAVAAWFISSMVNRVEAVERVQIHAAPQGERLTRLEEKVVAVQATASRIEGILMQPAKSR